MCGEWYHIGICININRLNLGIFINNNHWLSLNCLNNYNNKVFFKFVIDIVILKYMIFQFQFQFQHIS